MAYDHFVAIGHPLNYTVIMNPQLCVLLVLVSWGHECPGFHITQLNGAPFAHNWKSLIFL
jgi:hypothetical protein